MFQTARSCGNSFTELRIMIRNNYIDIHCVLLGAQSVLELSLCKSFNCFLLIFCLKKNHTAKVACSNTGAIAN